MAYILSFSSLSPCNAFSFLMYPLLFLLGLLASAGICTSFDLFAVYQGGGKPGASRRDWALLSSAASLMHALPTVFTKLLQWIRDFCLSDSTKPTSWSSQTRRLFKTVLKSQSNSKKITLAWLQDFKRKWVANADLLSRQLWVCECSVKYFSFPYIVSLSVQNKVWSCK